MPRVPEHVERFLRYRPLAVKLEQVLEEESTKIGGVHAGEAIAFLELLRKYPEAISRTRKERLLELSRVINAFRHGRAGIEMMAQELAAGRSLQAVMDAVRDALGEQHFVGNAPVRTRRFRIDADFGQYRLTRQDHRWVAESVSRFPKEAIIDALNRGQRGSAIFRMAALLHHNVPDGKHAALLAIEADPHSFHWALGRAQEIGRIEKEVIEALARVHEQNPEGAANAWRLGVRTHGTGFAVASQLARTETGKRLIGDLKKSRWGLTPNQQGVAALLACRHGVARIRKALNDGARTKEEIEEKVRKNR